MPNVPCKPSEMFRDSLITVILEAGESLLAETIDFVGVEHVMYATDIPHWDCEFPENLQSLRTSTKLSSEIKRQVLYDNAKEFYRL